MASNCRIFAGSDFDERNSYQQAQEGDTVITSINEWLGLPEDYEFRERVKMKTASGRMKNRMDQYYKGLPVYDTVVNAEYDGDTKQIFSVTGHMIIGIESDIATIQPKIGKEDIVELIVANEGGRCILSEPDHMESDFVETFELQVRWENGRAILAYLAQFISDDGNTRQYVVNADTKEIIKCFNNQCGPWVKSETETRKSCPCLLF